jgi:hypothetical protein
MIRFEKPARRAIEPSFKHGRYLDAWSILHLTTGLTIGIFMVIFGLDFSLALTVSMLLMFGYELLEAVLNIVECVKNAITDILVGALGVTLIYSYDFYADLTSSEAWATVGGLILIDCIVLFLGWNSFLRKRLGKKDPDLSPSTETAEGKWQIMLDQLYFFGFGITFIPLPVIYIWFGEATAIAWFLIATTTTFLIRYKSIKV